MNDRNEEKNGQEQTENQQEMRELLRIRRPSKSSLPIWSRSRRQIPPSAWAAA